MGDELELVAVFVASSDNTRDVFERVFPAFRKQWPDCPYHVYAGFIRPSVDPVGFTPVYAPVSGWGQEVRTQIAQVPAEHILLLLDDFVVLERVDTQWVQDLVETALSRDLAYLGFRQLRRPALVRLLHRCVRRGGGIEAVPERYPYYSSLQVALWKKAHLLSCLERETNIWKFERVRPEAVTHHVIYGDGPVRYRHIVERGRWLPIAQKALRKAGVSVDLGKRAAWTREYELRHISALLRFEMIGYSGMRFRQARAASRRRA